MKKEMKMMPNGNYEEVISPIQHNCHSKSYVVMCKEFGWNPGVLELQIEDGDPYEDGYAMKIEINYCPFCGYKPEKLNKNS